mmetsp:Transcript_14130/g.35085  ORF Transcript_14130/g.35085 Transcript_14130/m.35085 type:complete len:236 (+) Transcript_14130:199-906(+)
MRQRPPQKARKYSLGGYSIQQRQFALANYIELPTAIRVCPARTLSEYLLARLQHVGRVRSFLNSVKHAPRLKTAQLEVVRLMKARTALTFWRTLESRINAIFRGKQSARYGVESCLARLERARDAPGGQEELRASEHLDKDRPDHFWQLMALLGLIGAIQKGNPSVLGDIGEVDPCAICLESPGEKGSTSEWLQLEPCRHWLCATCAREQFLARGERKCCLCRTEIRMLAPGLPM